MLNNIIIGRYYPVKSKIHDMNPLAKIICILIFLVLGFVSNDFIVNILVFGYVAIVMGLSNVPSQLYYKTIYNLRILLIFVFGINLIFGVSFITTLIMVLRLISLVLYTAVLTFTTPPSEVAYGLELLFSPLKRFNINVSKMALSISLALRFIPTIINQTKRILKSQISRGIDFKAAPLKEKLSIIKSMLLPMFVLSFRRADALSDAMEVRLFSVNRSRTNHREHNWQIFDSYIVNMHIIMLLTLVMSEVFK